MTQCIIRCWQGISVTGLLLTGAGFGLLQGPWAQATELVLTRREVRSIRVESLGHRVRAEAASSSSSESDSELSSRSLWGRSSARSSSHSSYSSGAEFRILIRYRVDGHVGQATVSCETRGECEGLASELRQNLASGEQVVVNVDTDEGDLVWLRPSAPRSLTPICNQTPLSFLLSGRDDIRIRFRLGGDFMNIPAGVAESSVLTASFGRIALNCSVVMVESVPYDRELTPKQYLSAVQAGEAWTGPVLGYRPSIAFLVEGTVSQVQKLSCVVTGGHGSATAGDLNAALESMGVVTSIGTDPRCQSPQSAD